MPKCNSALQTESNSMKDNYTGIVYEIKAIHIGIQWKPLNRDIFFGTNSYLTIEITSDNWDIRLYGDIILTPEAS